MDILALYESLPATTLARAADRAQVLPSTLRARLLSADRLSWELVRLIVTELQDNAGTIAEQIDLLLRDRIPA